MLASFKHSIAYGLMFIPASATSPLGNWTSRTTSQCCYSGSSIQWTRVSSKSKTTTFFILLYLNWGRITDF